MDFDDNKIDVSIEKGETKSQADEIPKLTNRSGHTVKSQTLSCAKGHSAIEIPTVPKMKRRNSRTLNKEELRCNLKAHRVREFGKPRMKDDL